MNNNTKNIFFDFVFTYLVIIVLVLACLFPVFSSLERSEREKATQTIFDYGQSKARELESTENLLFHTARNFYASQQMQSTYYSSSRATGTTLFYNMNQLQQTLKLYFQNIPYVQDVFVYIPKFDYVLSQKYIFRTRQQFYQLSQFQSFSEEDWLSEVFQPDYNMTFMPDRYLDNLSSKDALPVLNEFFVFPMTGDGNVHILMVVSMDSAAIAQDFLFSDLKQMASVTISDNTGTVLARYIPETWEGILSGIGEETISLKNDNHTIQIHIDRQYYRSIRSESLFLILRNIGAALLVGACGALYFSWNRSQPMERILRLIRKANLTADSSGKIGEIEDTVISMVSEIHQCKNTIENLSSMVNNNLLERLFYGELSPGKVEDSFIQCYGPMPAPCIAAVMTRAYAEEDFLPLPETIQSTCSTLELPIYVCFPRKEKLYLVIPSVPDIQEKLEQVLKSLREHGNGIVKAGISNPITSLQAVKEGTRQAGRRLDAGLHIQGIYLFTHTPSSKAAHNLLNVQSLDSLQRTLMSGNKSSADKIIGEIFQRLEPEKPDAIELRQLFFSLRSVYSSVISQFRLEAERNGQAVCEWLYLPNDLDDYQPDTVENAFLHMNDIIYEYYQSHLTRTTRNKGLDILTYIEENYSDPNLCASSIADHFGLSEKYVFQLVKGACGETLNDKISSLRVEKGISLLEQTDMSVTDIAAATGFTSSNSMYKVFMRVKGISPSSYRRKKINEKENTL